MKNSVIRSFIALLGATFLVVSAHAQSPTYAPLDALMGFRVTSGTGATLDGVIDLGPVSQFNHTFTLSLGNIGTFMTSNFGADWFTRTDPSQPAGTTSVQWAVVASGPTSSNAELWSTRNPSVQLTPWPRNFNQSVGSGLINSAGTAYTGYTIAAGTNNAVTQGVADINSWASFQPGGPNSNGISFKTWNPTNEGNTSMALAFDAIPHATVAGQVGTELGHFSWASDGTVTFTLVPEPETYRMFALGVAALCGLMILRRRRAAKAA